MYEYFDVDNEYKIFYTQSEVDLIEYIKFRVHNTIPHINIRHAEIIEMGDRLQTIYHNAYENYNYLVTFVANQQNIRFIGNNAFKNCKLLSSISFSINNIGYIGSSAFENCIGLTSLTIKNINNIWTNCFKDCSNLTTFTVLNNVGKIHDGAFRNCLNLNEFVVGGILEIIGKHSFINCTSLTNIEMNSITLIDDNAFYDCNSIQNVTIYSNNVQYIGKHAFENCFSLKSIHIYGNVSRIGRKAFYNCYNLTNINIEGDLEKVDNLAFYCDYNVYKNIYFTNNSIISKQDIKNEIETNLEIGRKNMNSEQILNVQTYSSINEPYIWSYNNEIIIENYLHTYNGGIYTFYSDVSEYTYFRKFSEIVMNKLSSSESYYDKLYTIILKNKFKFIEFDTTIGDVSKNIIICEQPVENVCFKNYKCVSTEFKKNITNILPNCFQNLTNDLNVHIKDHVDTIQTKAFVNNKDILLKVNSINTFESNCFQNSVNETVSNTFILHANTITNKFPSNMIVDFSSVQIYVNNYTHDIPSNYAYNSSNSGEFKCTINGPLNDMIIYNNVSQFANIYLNANKYLKIKTTAFNGDNSITEIKLHTHSINQIEKSAFWARNIDIICKDIFSCGGEVIETSNDAIFKQGNSIRIYANVINQLKSYTFYDCSGITIYCNIINSIPENTFYDCSGVTIYCKGMINSINSYAFTNVNSIQIFCDSILNFQEKIFVNCQNIKLYSIENVNLNGILNENSSMVNIEFNAGIKNIDLFVNKNRKIMQNVKLIIHDYTTTKIDERFITLFDNIHQIQIIFYKSIYIEDEAFDAINYFIDTIKLTFKKDVIQIGEKAFEDISANTFEILIEGNCYKIKNQAFFNSHITKFEVKLDVIHIGNEVFNGCTRLRQVITRNVSYIGEDVFLDCSNCEINTKNILYTNNIDLSKNVLLNLKGFVFYENYDITNVIQNSDNKVTEFVEETVNVNSSGNFKYVHSFSKPPQSSIEVFDVDYIEDYAFINSNTSDFYINGNVKYIGKNAFDNCVDLLSCNFQNVDDIGEYAFNNCKNIQTLTFQTVKRIHKYAFNNSCLSGCTITIGNVEDYIDCYILNGVSNITFKITGTVNSIRNFAFSSCSNVDISLNSVNDFQQYAFQNDSDNVNLSIINITDFVALNQIDTNTLSTSDISGLLQNKCTLNVTGSIQGLKSIELDENSLFDFIIYLLELNNREYKINDLKNELNKTKINLDDILSNDFGENKDTRLFNYIIRYSHIIHFKYSFIDNNHTILLNETFVPYITNIKTLNFKIGEDLNDIYSSLNSIETNVYEADSNLIKYVKDIEITENIRSNSLQFKNFPLDASKNLIIVNNNKLSDLPQIVSNVINYTGYFRFLNQNMLLNKAHINEFQFTGNIGTIGENAFEYFENMTTVYINGNVEEILPNAFKSCIHMEKFEVTGNIKCIHGKVFNNCLRLNIFKIGGNVENIQPLAFNNCYNLETINIGGSVNILHNYSLHFHKSYEYNNQIVAITSNVDTYRNASNIFETDFLNNDSDTKYGIISKYMNGDTFEFNGYSQLDLRIINAVNYKFNGKTEIYNDSSVIGIHKKILSLDISGAGIILNLSNLDIITLNVYGTIEDIVGTNCNITNWNMYGYIASINSISRFIIPNINIYGIIDTIQADQGFINCTINSFNINGSINKLGIKTFVQTSIDNFNLIGYVNSIVDSTDSGKTYNKEYVILDSNLNSSFDINTDWDSTEPFSNIEKVNVSRFSDLSTNHVHTIESIGNNNNSKTFFMNGNIYCISGNAFNDLNTDFEIFEISGNIYKIESYAFHNCSRLSEFIVHGCVYEIEQDAFYGCYSLEKFNVGYCIHSIGYRAFDTFVKQFTIETPVIHDISQCFVQNYNMVPRLDVDHIYNSDYPEIYKFKSEHSKIVKVGEEYTDLNYTPSNIKHVYISHDIDVIKSKVFENISLDDFSANNIKEIEHFAFMNSTINTFTCKNVNYIHYYAFRDCSLNSITISNIECIHENAFDNCVQLSDFSCNNVKYIAKKAFIGCNNLSNFSINNIFHTTETLYIYSSAFIDCTDLSSVVVNKPLILETNNEERFNLDISHNENIIIDKNTFERQFIENINITSTKLVLIKEGAFQNTDLQNIHINCSNLYIESSIKYLRFFKNIQLITPQIGNLM